MKSIGSGKFSIRFAAPILGSLILAQASYAQSQTNANPRVSSPQPSFQTSVSASAMAQNTNSSVLSQASQPNTVQPSAAFQTVAAPQLTLQNGGALYQTVSFSVSFANDITAPGAVDVVPSSGPSSGQHIKASIYGLAYIDFASSHSTLLAQLKPSTGQILPGGKRLLFPNCFDSGIAADVEFDLAPNSVEQLVVLRKRIAGPDAFNLPATSRLVVITALDAPVPKQVPRLIDLRPQKAALQVEAEDSMQDATLIFGSLRMTAGRAWSMGGVAQPVPVAKNWQTFQGYSGTYLLESAPYSLLRPQIEALPTASLPPRTKAQPVQDMLKRHPAPLVPPRSAKPIEVVKVEPEQKPGVVLDWILVSSALLNINFAGGGKTGPAAIGETTNDVWNVCATSYQSNYYITSLVWSDGSSSDVGVEVVNGQGAWGNGSPDPMYNSYLYPWNSGDMSVYLTNLPAGAYDIYIYGHGLGDNGNAVYDLWVGSTEYGQKGTTMWGSGWSTTNWEGGQQYVVYRSVTLSAGDAIYLDAQHGASGYAFVNGMQIVPSDSISHDPPAMYRLIDVDFGGDPQKFGYAAVGIATNDTWNWYGNSFYRQFSGSIAPLVWSDGTSTTSGLLLTNAPGFWGMTAGDNMYDTFVYHSGSNHIGIVLTNLSTGGLAADFYVYAHAGSADDNAVISLTTGGTNYGPRGTTIWGTSWTNANWEEGAQYVVFRNIPISTNQPVFIDVQPGAAGYPKINGMQIAVPLDRDGNGLPDWWEIQYFGHTGVDANADPDGDGVSNWYEYLYHTDPNNAFTGGVPDRWTAQWQLTTADPDFDGLSNSQEYFWGSNPTVSEGLAIWVGMPTGFSGIP